MGGRRAIVLLLVHVAFLIHLSHWLASGRTLSPIEPSEALYTTAVGHINAGAIFFALAILSTLIFGRFFCGWGCHVVALQDLCGWMMKKMGVRPRPFRTRLLGFGTLMLAVYIFFWPLIKRAVVIPLLDRVWPRGLALVGSVAPFPVEGFTNHLMTDDLWATFPGLAVGVSMLLVCGFVTVYFLGAKGFCNYGCPYGAFFAPADRLAPGRIVVDHDKCHQCGHCTAVCTSNVRVSDEVREYGMVVDPGCMKCMDCVSVCPNGALSFGFARPSVAKGKPRKAAPKRVYDTTLAQDAVLLGLGLLVFFAVRDPYDVVSSLMAAGLSAIIVFVAWKLWRTLTRRDERLVNMQLRRAGRFTRAGLVFAPLAVALVVLVAHTGFINWHRNAGDRLFAELRLAKQAFLRDPGSPQGRVPPATLDAAAAEKARRAIRHYLVASSPADGGRALYTTTTVHARLALLRLALGELDAVGNHLGVLSTRAGPDDALDADRGSLLLHRGDARGAEALWREALRTSPHFWQVQEELCKLLFFRGRADEAIASCTASLERIPESGKHARARAHTLLTLGRMRAALGDLDEAERTLRRAAEAAPDESLFWVELSGLVLQRGTMEAAKDALRLLERAAEAAPSDFELALNAADLAEAIGDSGTAARHRERALRIARAFTGVLPRDPGTRLNLVRAELSLGNVSEAEAALALARRDGADESRLRAFEQALRSARESSEKR